VFPGSEGSWHNPQ